MVTHRVYQTALSLITASWGNLAPFHYQPGKICCSSLSEPTAASSHCWFTHFRCSLCSLCSVLLIHLRMWNCWVSINLPVSPWFLWKPNPYKGSIKHQLLSILLMLAFSYLQSNKLRGIRTGAFLPVLTRCSAKSSSYRASTCCLCGFRLVGFEYEEREGGETYNGLIQRERPQSLSVSECASCYSQSFSSNESVVV